MWALHERPRPLPHFGSAVGEPRSSQVLSASALTFSTWGPAALGRPARGTCLPVRPSPGSSAWIAPTHKTKPSDSIPLHIGVLPSACGVQLVRRGKLLRPNEPGLSGGPQPVYLVQAQGIGGAMPAGQRTWPEERCVPVSAPPVGTQLQR